MNKINKNFLSILVVALFGQSIAVQAVQKSTKPTMIDKAKYLVKKVGGTVVGGALVCAFPAVIAMLCENNYRIQTNDLHNKQSHIEGLSEGFLKNYVKLTFQNSLDSSPALSNQYKGLLNERALYKNGYLLPSILVSMVGSYILYKTWKNDTKQKDADHGLEIA